MQDQPTHFRQLGQGKQDSHPEWLRNRRFRAGWRLFVFSIGFLAAIIVTATLDMSMRMPHYPAGPAIQMAAGLAVSLALWRKNRALGAGILMGSLAMWWMLFAWEIDPLP